MQITLSINKGEVMAAVAQTAAYTAAKLPDGELQYQRVAVVSADAEIMDKYFTKATNEMAQTLRGAVVMQSTIGKVYQVILEVSSSFSDALIAGMQSTLQGYIHSSIAAHWLALTGQEAAADHQALAAQYLLDLRRNTLYKKAPARPEY